MKVLLRDHVQVCVCVCVLFTPETEALGGRPRKLTGSLHLLYIL